MNHSIVLHCLQNMYNKILCYFHFSPKYLVLSTTIHTFEKEAAHVAYIFKSLFHESSYFFTYTLWAFLMAINVLIVVL